MEIIYNGVRLRVTTCHEFAQEPVYDDAGIDYLFTKVSISCTALVNGQTSEVAPFDVDSHRARFGTSYVYGSQGGGGGGTTLPEPGGSGEGLTKDTLWAHNVNTRPSATDLPQSGVTAPDNIGVLNHDIGANLGMSNVMNNANFPGNVKGVFPGQTGITADASRRQLVVIREGPNEAVLTDRLIRHRLTTPRGMLWVFSGTAGGNGDETDFGEVLLQSPGWGKFVDSHNGPLPRVYSIEQWYGDAATFVVNFQIETYINESAQHGVFDPGPLLSNRFSSTHVIDEDSYLQIQTQGVALFDTSKVFDPERPCSPDSIRPRLFQPVPLGFVRSNIVVQGMEDVSGVRYSYTDSQQHVNFAAGPYAKASHIEAVHRQAILTDSDVLSGALAAYERALNIKWTKKHLNDPSDATPPKKTHPNILHGHPQYQPKLKR